MKLSNGAGTLKFTKLKPNTEYVVRLSKNNETLLEIPFKTFGYIDALYGFKLFYFIDLTDTKASQVKVTIFGQFNGGPTFSIGRHNYHLTDEAMIFVTNPRVSFYETSGKASSMVVASKRLVYIYPEDDKGYFKIEYVCDKSKRPATVHGVEGHLCDKYFMASHEQFLIFPESTEEVHLKRFALSAVVPFGWKLNTWWVRSKAGILYAPEKKAGEPGREIGATLGATHLYAYDPRYFGEYQKKVSDTNILVIKEKSIKEPWEEYTFKVYQRLVELWGGDVDYRRYNYRDYVVMYVDDPTLIYAGEYTDAQGFSSAFGFSEMVVHQIFHRWNGWVCDIKKEHKWQQGESHMFWTDGFNEFYCDKVLTELRLTGPNMWMKMWYQQYKAIYGTSRDGAVVYYDPNKHDVFVAYGKGAIIVYYMDKKLREITNNKYSMDDVLKYFLKNWEEKNQPFTYERLLAYLEQLGGKEYVNEVREIIYKNKRVVLPEFE